MKSVLYFVKSGIPSDIDKAKAEAIKEEFGINVAFRNATKAGRDPIEACAGVMGDFPSGYDGFRKYGADVKPEAPNEPVIDQGGNPLGLPDGAPETEQELKEDLEKRGIPFHGRSKVKRLKKIYLEEVLGETPSA